MLRKKRGNRTGNESAVFKFIPSFLFSALLAVALTAGFCALIANTMCNIDIKPSLLVTFTTVLLGIAILLSSLVFSLINRGGILSGTVLATVFFVILCVCSFALYRIPFTELWITKGVTLLISGALGGYIATLLQERKRKIRH